MITATHLLFPGMGGLFEKLAVLSSSEFKFRLTGSRFFGRATSASDYDFYIESSPEVEDFLAKLGFEENGDSSHYHQDRLMHKLYTLEAYGHTIHVQLIFPEQIRLKERLHEILEVSGLCQCLDKPQRRQLWQAVEKAALES